jgi:prolyl oligopeptidase
MQRFVFFGALIGIMTLATTAQTIKYPQAKKSDVVEDYHGTKVADPYRWLEDADAAETAAWVEAENKVTQAYLAGLPSRARYKERLTALYNYERYSRFQKAGARYLFQRNDGLQNQDVIYAADSLTGKERVLLDPNKLRADGTAALTEHVASSDGKLLAYGVADAGSDWAVWHVRNVETGQDLGDEVRWSKFMPPAWAPDNRSFYYLRFPEPKAGEALRAANEFAKIYLHKVGEPQSQDKLVYERPDHKDWLFAPVVTDDGRYLLIGVEAGDAARNLLFYQDLKSGTPRTVELISQWKAAYVPLGNRGSVLYVQTTDGAPRGRIVAIDLAKPEPANWREIVPQQNETVEAVQLLSDRMVLSSMKDAASRVKVYGLDGRLMQDVALPGVGSVAFYPARQSDREMFFAFTSFTLPRVMCRLDDHNALSIVRQSKLSFDPSKFETHQVFYNSKDGTRVPMTLVHRKGLVLDGRNPTLLYGYGGFNISLLPAFNSWVPAWLEAGGVYAVANLRGGGEYGEEWHQAGTKAHKQNVFDDFIAAAEWLISNKYTSTPKLAIFGGSNGGLLVGAVLNQRPDLFGAAMPAVGVMDMLRFQKFTIGSAWVGDYGSSDNPEDFQALRAYSPLHNIKVGTKYPAVLITTSDHDDRVVPGHSFKYAAAVQAAQEGKAPILIRIETRAGHGSGKPTTKIIDEYADRLAFLTKELGME